MSIKIPAVVEEDGLLGLHHLSYSSLSKYRECPFKWGAIYVLGYRRPPPWWLPVGTAGHAALERNNMVKIASGEYMPTGDLAEYTDMIFDKQLSMEEEGVEWYDEDEGKRKRYLVQQVGHYRKHKAPRITPVSAELSWEQKLEGMDALLTGRIDTILGDNGAFVVQDYKFPKSNRKKNEAQITTFDMQGTFYNIALMGTEYDGASMRYDYFLNQKDVNIQTIGPFPVHEWLKVFALQTILAYHDKIKAGLDMLNQCDTIDVREVKRAFPPSPNFYPGQSYGCGPGQCEYSDICFGSGSPVFVLN